MSRLSIPEVAMLHTTKLSWPEAILRSAGVSEPFSLHIFNVLPAEEVEGPTHETRVRLERVMEDISLSHLLIQDRLMKPIAEIAKLAIGMASWYSPISENFVFGIFDDGNKVTQMPLETARAMAQFIEIPDIGTLRP